MIIESDVLIVGAGPAGLAAAIALRRGNANLRVVVLDKGRNAGSHVLSGAVIDPSGFKGLLTDDEIAKLPFDTGVTKESFRFLFGENSSVKIPWVPPMMRQIGFPVGSATKLAAYLAAIAQKEGAEIYTGYAVTELVEQNGRIAGARTGEKGRGKDGAAKANFLASEEIRAKTVILAEGAAGILTGKLVKDKNLGGKKPQTYALGIKELVEIPAAPERKGEIMHTFGWPVDMKTYGGGFVYHTSETQVMVGYVVGLDYRDASLDAHELFRKFKSSAAVAEHIKGGKAVAYGAKIIPEGGYYALPQPYFPGALIIGDGAGLMDGLRIKGVHLALQSAKAAAEAILADDEASYPGRLKATKGYGEVKRVRNVHGGFTYGAPVGVMMAGFAWATFGKFPFWAVGRKHKDCELNEFAADKTKDSSTIRPDALSPDRLTDVFMSGTMHEEDQPCHLKIRDRAKCAACERKYKSPCTRFCPAEVYRREGDELAIDFSNCLHCKTCKVKCPMENVEWTFPQGGDGPRYTRL
ncbi:MAG: 4Fe-4S dicluster domain-containing protein [Kiritimatiellae bacterium]|nr:4Fe-4S dicluster domain-containing protein [Kiritimatiellia bacterium]